jgi:heme/copper-type cytochrome/quinol oxidase subunit 3
MVCCVVMVILLGILFMWMNDYGMESIFGFSRTEQFLLICGVKLLIFSEWMLFVGCFWGSFNFRFVSNGYGVFFSYPLLSSYSFAIPYSNVIILLFSSLPIQSSMIFYKVGLFMGCIEQLGQTISCGMMFLVLQIKEFFYSYLSVSDCMVGSIFYFTTGLHGLHVFIGLLCFYCIMFLMFFCNVFLIGVESSFSLLLSSYY